MTKGIEDFLNLPHLEDTMKIEMVDPDEYEDAEEIQAVAMIPPDFNPLSKIEGNDHAEAMVKLHHDMMKHGNDLVDLAYNGEPRSATSTIEQAAGMFRLALDAMNSKREAELKAMKLELDFYKTRGKQAPIVVHQQTEPNAQIVVSEDRNKILKRLRDEKLKADGIQPDADK